MEEVRRSAQAIIVTPRSTVLLEDNTKLQVLCFIGGAIEQGETAADALIREMKEETRLIIGPERLEQPEIQPPRIFQTGTWQSIYSILRVNPDEVQKILGNARNIDEFELFDLQGMRGRSFSLPNEIFLEQVSRALVL